MDIVSEDSAILQDEGGWFRVLLLMMTGVPQPGGGRGAASSSSTVRPGSQAVRCWLAASCERSEAPGGCAPSTPMSRAAASAPSTPDGPGDPGHDAPGFTGGLLLGLKFSLPCVAAFWLLQAGVLPSSGSMDPAALWKGATATVEHAVQLLDASFGDPNNRSLVAAVMLVLGVTVLIRSPLVWPHICSAAAWVHGSGAPTPSTGQAAAAGGGGRGRPPVPADAYAAVRAAGALPDGWASGKMEDGTTFYYRKDSPTDICFERPRPLGDGSEPGPTGGYGKPSVDGAKPVPELAAFGMSGETGFLLPAPSGDGDGSGDGSITAAAGSLLPAFLAPWEALARRLPRLAVAGAVRRSVSLPLAL
jgi:hypothetical protein